MRSHVTASPVGSTLGRRARLGALACAAFMALLALAAASASASITREPESFSPLDGSGSGVSIIEPSGIGVDEASGNVFVTDGTNPSTGEENNAVLILGEEGGAPSGLISPFEIAGLDFGANTPVGLAYDNSAASPGKGTLYVYDRTTESIKRFARNGASERYEEAGTPIAVTGAGQNSAGLGLDAAGNIYLGSFATNSIYRFSPAGVLLHQWNNPAELPTEFPGQIAVDAAGDLFIQAQGGIGGAFKCPVGAGEAIDPASCIHFVTANATGAAYDPTTNHVFVALATRVIEYDATSLAKISEFGKEGPAGEEGLLGFTARIAVNAETDRVYVVDADTSSGRHPNVAVFGPPVVVPTTKAGAASNLTGTRATLNGSINPEGIAVTECTFEWGPTTAYGNAVPCASLPPTDSATHAVSADLSGLTPNGTTYHYRLVAGNENGTEKSADKTLVTADTVTTEAATGVTSTTATLHGTVRPEGLEFSQCAFEYKLSTEASFEEVPCDPAAGEIEADFEAHQVSAALTGLQPNAKYEFRLAATNAEGPLSGKTLAFITPGPPQIAEIRALSATQASVLLEGKINPSGFGTSYRFEWGPTASYGHQVPAEFEPFVGSGTDPVRVSVKLSGLSAASTYHYRIVATSPAGVTASPDQTLETLNSCGLVEGRCFELVSRSEAGPVANPGIVGGGGEFHFQAAAAGAGALAYPVESGYPEASKGAEVLYRGVRDGAAHSWGSTQISPPLSTQSGQAGSSSAAGKTLWLSPDLSCGVIESFHSLSDDPGTRLAFETGGENLYRLNPDGSHTAITSLAPSNAAEIGSKAKLSYYAPALASEDCSKILFTTEYRYPGVPAAGNLYEWEEGTLRSAGLVPGPSGEVAVAATMGGGEGNRANALSPDGSRAFFSATRQVSPNPAEVGKKGVFVREDGTHTVDVSLSQTATPDTGASYLFASEDGSRVFFRANAGLTAQGSSEGQDLYEYDFAKPEGERLTDLSVTQASGGAEVVGVAGASRDGSSVFFAARGQLLPGRGSSYAQNSASASYSLYGSSEGTLGFAGTITESDLGNVTPNWIGGSQKTWSSRVSPDGRYLLFEATARVTAYDSGGTPEAYLYDAAASTEATTCISCRPDGKPSVISSPQRVLLPGQEVNFPNYVSPPRNLIVRDGRPEVIFSSPDPLGSGSTEGQYSLFLWAHGQVFRLSQETGGAKPIFADASEDGSDLYLATAQTLNWEDGDDRPSVYDARVGGGFPEPPAPPAPCNPATEGSCQGAPAGAPPALGAASAAFAGAGNPPASESAGHKKKKHKKKAKKHRRNAKHNRRAGK